MSCKSKIIKLAVFSFLSFSLSACGGGASSGGGGGGGSTTIPIAFYAYGAAASSLSSSGNGNTEISAINSNGVLSGNVITGPETGIGPGQETLVTVSGNRYLYVANSNSGQNNTISVFGVNGTTLTSLPQIVASSNLAPLAQMVYSAGVLFVPHAYWSHQLIHSQFRWKPDPY